jgi:hypothetical protein
LCRLCRGWGGTRLVSVAFHTEGLARACLPVRKNADVVAIEDARDQRLHLSEHLLLRRVWPEAVVEFEQFLAALGVVLHVDALFVELGPVAPEEYRVLAPLAALVLELRADAAEDADVACAYTRGLTVSAKQRTKLNLSLELRADAAEDADVACESTRGLTVSAKQRTKLNLSLELRADAAEDADVACESTRWLTVGAKQLTKAEFTSVNL